MKRKLLFLISIICIAGNVWSQTYGNEWIKFTFGNAYSDQEYFKISVWKNGIYRLTYADLLNAGFPITEDPRKFQLFALGKEQYIHVEGESDGTFDLNDYIQFVGYRNDGTVDSALYGKASYQVNNKRSLIGDTVFYFLTVNINSIQNKRIVAETDVNVGAYTASPYFMRNVFLYLVPNGNYYYRGYQELGAPLSEYTDGEGYAIDYLAAGDNASATNFAKMNTPNNAGVGNTQFRTFIGGHSSYAHPYKVTLNSVDYANSLFYGTFFEPQTITFSHIGNQLDWKITALANPQGKQEPNAVFVRYIDVDYPHSYSFAGESDSNYVMTISPSQGTAKSAITLSNISFTQPIMYVYVNDSVKQIPLVLNGNTWQCVVPTNYQSTRAMLGDGASIITNSGNKLQLAKVNYKGAPAGRFNNFAYDLSKNYLLVTHQKFWNDAVAYGNYRGNNAIKNYNVLLADIDELYAQFAYGIPYHPLSVKGFTKFTLYNFNSIPEHLFIIGKGIEPQYTLDNHAGIYVPTFGMPPSDNMFTAQINEGDSIIRPTIAVGRLPVMHASEVTDYMNKVMSYESAPKGEWMKNVMHFAGGSNAAESQGFQLLMNDMGSVLEDTCMGAYIRTLSKTINTPIQINLSANLQNIIDSGLTLMTFLAHAASSSFDITTDVPSSWKNKNRYPLIVANSCYVGNMHKPVRLAAEDFVLQKDKGAIGFIGQSLVGFVDNLYPYSKTLYRNFSWYNYGATIGTQMLRTIDTMQTNYAVWGMGPYMAQSVSLDMALLGDPAIVLNSPQQPDLAATTSDIHITPQNVSTADDSLTVKITLRNIAKAINTPFIVKVTRTYPNLVVADTLLLINKLAYTDTVVLRLPVDRAQGAGLNTISVELDLNDQVKNECSEINNATSVQFFIKSNDINALFPAKYAIVPDSNVTLVTSTANPLAAPTVYVFQIDTNDTFNSPTMHEHKLTAPGGIINYTIPFPIVENRVYYWRVSRDSLPGDLEHPYWDEKSFIYKKTKTGWSQAHIYQFKNDGYNNMLWNRQNQNWEFITTKSVLRANNNVNNYYIDVNFFINGIVQASAACFPQGVNAAINVAVIDDATLIPWNSREPGRNYGNWNNDSTKCIPTRPDNYFVFPSHPNYPEYMDSLNALLTKKIPAGKYVLIYSVNKNWYNAIPQTVKNTLQLMGSDTLQYLNDNNCWTFFARMGSPGSAHEVVGDSLNPIVTLFDSLGGNWDRGFMVSERIGPGVKWSSLHWETSQLANTDTVVLDLIGIKDDGSQTLFLDDLPPTTNDVFNLDQFIDSTYKYLEMRAYFNDDSVFPTPAYMNMWQIYYQQLPEAMVDPSLYLYISKSKLNEADTVTVSTAIKNIGTEPMDSMLVDFYLYDAQNKKYNYPQKLYKPLNPGDTLHCSVAIPTAGLGGNNVLWIEANPNNHQPEQYHFNNYAQIPLKVDVDITNPILDVTFDGVHILNEDIVSAKPRIDITLNDENTVLVMDDTSDFYVTLDEATVFQPKRMFFEPQEGITTSPSLLTWRKAKLPENKFEIQLKPILNDGLYKLTVQGKDKSNNTSAGKSYTISFEVENKPTITHVMNYPNPFSSSTRFVFTLTGSEIPEYFKIQVMTVSGKVVREINIDELGPLHIGRNITQYAWDGTDEFGDKLANGVYLYRVVTRLNGQSIEAREMEADHFFVNGWGKMYLLR